MYHHLSSIKVRGACSGLGETGEAKLWLHGRPGFPRQQSLFLFLFRIINFALQFFYHTRKT